MSNIFCGLIPSDILQDKRLTQTDKLLMGVFLGFHFNNKTCTASNNTLGKTLGISGSASRIAIYRLRELGLINIEIEDNCKRIISCNYQKDSVQSANILILEGANRRSGDANVLSWGVTVNDQGGANTLTGGVLTDDHQRNNIINNLKNNNNISIGAIAPQETELIKPSLEITKPKKPKTSICHPKESINQEQYEKILNDPTLANGDIEYLKEQVRSMTDWSLSSSKRKANWSATLRNWIRRSRQNGILPNGIEQKSKVKIFRELEEDWDKKQTEEFLRRTS